MIKLLEVKSLGDSKFEVLLSQNEIKKKYVIAQHETVIDLTDEPLSYINAEDKSFYDVWGQSFSFRQEVSKKIT